MYSRGGDRKMLGVMGLGCVKGAKRILSRLPSQCENKEAVITKISLSLARY